MIKEKRRLNHHMNIISIMKILTEEWMNGFLQIGFKW